MCELANIASTVIVLISLRETSSSAICRSGLVGGTIIPEPGGIPVATFAVGPAGAKNAAVFAAQIVAGHRPDVARAVADTRRAGAEAVVKADDTIQRDRRRGGAA